MYTPLSSRYVLDRSFSLQGSHRDRDFTHARENSARRFRIKGKCGRIADMKLRSMSRDDLEVNSSEDWIEMEDDCDPCDNLGRFKGLVLDLTYRPINVISWKRSLCLEILDKAEVLAYYDRIVCSPSRAFFIPAVLRMSDFVYAPKPKRVKLSLSKNNVFIRDRFKCQYCDRQEDLTIDHVLPLSKGGGNTWDNLVTACKYCNGKKGNRSVEDAQMKLRKQPQEPRAFDNRELPPSYRVFKALVFDAAVPSEWIDYLPDRPSKAYRWPTN